MSNFITILKKTAVASTHTSIKATDQFKNISGNELLDKIRQPSHGNKDGSHFMRTALKIMDNGHCMPRNDANIESVANLLLIDCDKKIDGSGEEKNGAPDPLVIHSALRNLNIGHIIYGSYSHYAGDKGNRYRIIVITNKPYDKEQLPATAEALVLLINKHIDEDLLAYAKENNAFSQGWYYPRRPTDSNVDTLYFEYLEGLSFAVVEPRKLPSVIHSSPHQQQWPGSKVSTIHAFNEQNRLTELLSQYGYKRKLVTSTHEKWLSPDSSSGIAGITVKDGKFFSHHNDPFNDGYWHDAFDLMRISEGLSKHDAVIQAGKTAIAPDRRSVDKHNRNALNRMPNNIAPQPLPESRPDVLPFQAEMLPDAIRDYVFDVANRQQSLPDFVAVTAIVGLSGLLGRKALIRPKQLDDWSVTPNQWGAIIGRPSAMKSPSMKEALKPLRQLGEKAKQKFEEEKKNYEEDSQLIELEKLVAKGKAKKALKSDNRQEARDALRLESFTIMPVRQRFIVNDPSVEMLGVLLNENPNGLILVRDELSGWLAKLHREDYQSDRAFYLECFDGNGHYTYDRIGRGTIEIQHCTLSIIGGIQPSKIATLVRDAIKGTADDGLIQRLQLAVWPDDIGSWSWVDRPPNKQAREKYNAVFETIHNLKLNPVDEEPRCFRFTNEAQGLFITWMKEIQKDARSSDIHPALESHMLKMPQTIAGLALLFEIIDGGREAVGAKATARALEWADYLLSHAKRLYSIAINHSLDGAKLILDRKSKLFNPFTARDVQRKGWSGLDSTEAVNESLNWLIDYGHIVTREISATDTNGRPKVVYKWVGSKQTKENGHGAMA